MRFDGSIKSWNDERGFGFIEPLQGGQEVFVHVKAFKTRSGRPQVGQKVTFEVALNPDGKKRATSVEPLKPARSSGQSKPAGPAQWGTASYFAIAGFGVIYLGAAVLWRLPGWVAGWYVIASVVTGFLYASDKAAAIAGRRRISEATLLGFGLVGGWPGAIVSQQLLRHKSNKVSFRSAFWGTVVFNVVGFLFMASPSMRHALGN